MTEAGRNTRRELSPGQQRLGLVELVDLTAYRIHLQMILQRLEGLASTAGDQGTTEQHKRLSDVKRFLRGASTCLGLVLDLTFDRPAGKPESDENNTLRARRRQARPPAVRADRTQGPGSRPESDPDPPGVAFGSHT